MKVGVLPRENAQSRSVTKSGSITDGFDGCQYHHPKLEAHAFITIIILIDKTSNNSEELVLS